jgi:hypothetical protein
MKKTWIIGWLLVLCSCSSTQITSSWRNKNVPSTNYQKIMVVALIPDNQRNVLQAMENSMVDQLRRKGYNAVSSFQEFGPKAFQGMTEQQALSKVKSDNADAMVTISQTNHSRSRTYVPGTIYPSPWGWGWGWGGGYYSPGYVRNDVRYAWETNFYDIPSDKVLYSVQSRSFDPSSAYDLAEDYSRQIVRDMRDKGVLLKSGHRDRAED